MKAGFPLAGLRFERRIELPGRAVHIKEAVENLSASDRPIAWTQHVTLGPPFLDHGTTQFRASATRSKVFEGQFGNADYLVPAAEFDWPLARRTDGGFADLRALRQPAPSSAFTTHLMDPTREYAFFVAFSPAFRLAFGYVWKQQDFPWMGIWEENHGRVHAPWNGQCLARGMEFGVSPFPESRRSMTERGRLFGVSTYRWLQARSRLEVEYWAILQESSKILESLELPA
jgi:hypothetical protein